MILNPHTFSPKRTRWYLGLTCLSFVCLLVFGIDPARSEDLHDKEIITFFQSVEDSFIHGKIGKIMDNLHRNFSYTMSYDTDGHLSSLESDLESYRQNLGAFFKSKPDIHEYSIEVEDINRSGEVINVTARVISVVHLNNLLNSCEAMSKYELSYLNNRFIIKSVKGKATCTNIQAGDIE